MTTLVAERALRDRRRGLTGWSVGIGAYVAMIAGMWSSIDSSEQLKSAMKDYPEAIKDFFGGSAFDLATPVGYVNMELFSLLVPLLLVVFAIGWGSSTIAGEQERGVLDLILVNPVRRRRVVAEKALALTAGLVLLATVGGIVLGAIGAATGMGLSTTGMVAAFTGAVLLCLLHGLLAMLVGAGTGSRGTAIGVAAAVFTAGYLLQALAGLVSWLEPVRVLSPFYLYNGSVPLANGFPVMHFLVLAALSVLALAASVLVFERRDLAG